MLFPEQTTTRTLSDLSGIWNFQIEQPGHPLSATEPLPAPITMAVPGSFNDQVVDDAIRDHAGYFWYETILSVPAVLLKRRLVLRFGSATHSATVYINGQEVGQHTGGFTPFEFVINDYVHAGKNDLKVRLSNILDYTTLPVGNHSQVDGRDVVEPNFDFYNYAGIHRPVKLYSTATTYTEKITVKYTVTGETTTVTPDITVRGDYARAKVTITDEDNQVVATANQLGGPLTINKTHRWNVRNAYLYNLTVELFDNDGQLLDDYTEPFGIRTIQVKDCQLLINDKPVYLKGFGRHEDFPVLGKGQNMAVSNLDHNLMKDLNANSFRTSHYPYSEEEMRLADRDGFIVIDEVPAVGLYANMNVDVSSNFTNDATSSQTNTWEVMKTSQAHKQVLRETIARDQNHPSVFMWSIANEPASSEPGAGKYFKPLFELAHKLDWEHRPRVSANILSSTPEKDEVAPLVDLLCLNRYYGWYLQYNDLEAAKKALRDDLAAWHKRFPDKPIMFTEFGADTQPGLHSRYHDPYSEEYQVDYYKTNFEVFDECPYFIGEHLWNIADFATAPTLIRVDGNKKGVFTRDRQPKQIVPLLRERWAHK